MIRLDSVHGRNIAVLGYGRSGEACSRSLVAAGKEVSVWDDDGEKRKAARDSGFGLLKDGCDARGQRPDLLVISPGIPHHYPEPHRVVADALAAGVPVDNEIGLFFRAIREQFAGGSKPVIVAITGSNGKSTTAALLHHILQSCGRSSCLAGNFGFPVSSMADPGVDDIIVLEMSSYQSEIASMLEPDIAVFMNFHLDHLDRHGGPGGYLAAKRRVFQGECLRHGVVCMDQPEGRLIAGEIAARMGPDCVTGFSTGWLPGMKRSIRCMNGYMVEYSGTDMVDSIDIANCPSLQGIHNIENAAAALAVARLLGIPGHLAAAQLHTYAGLPHRNQLVGVFNGISVYNDSKATNASSALQALSTHRNICWIAGGRAKQNGITEIAERLGNVRKAYLIGESAKEFASQMKTKPHEILLTMDKAVEQAASDARPGDTILLSPAAASFDQYRDFEERGDDFVLQVRRHLSMAEQAPGSHGS